MSQLLFLTFLLCLVCSSLQGETWQGPPSFSSGKFYQLKVNGENVPVYDTPIASYAIFDFKGEANLEIETMFDVRWVDVRPLRWGLKPNYTGDHSFRIKMSHPANLSVELNGRIRQQPLFIFAGASKADIPDRNDPNVIWFDSGKLYKDVKLELQDNQTAYIEGGAVVQGYIFANNKKNIKVLGRGILDGIYNSANTENQKRFLYFKDCENVSVEGVTLHNGTTWQVTMLHCNHASIKGIRIVSENSGDDGIDLVRCTHVRVEDVFAHTKDDCIAVKSGGDYPNTHPTDDIVVRNCVFWNSLWGNAIEVGFELNSDEVKNVRFEDIDIIHVEDGAALSIHNAGPAHVHDVVFENIRVEDCQQKLIDVAIFFSQWGPDGIRDPDFIRRNYLHGAWDGVQKIPEGRENYHRRFRGKVSDILFKEIQIVGGALPFSVFHGFDFEKNVSNVSIENLTYMGKKLIDISSARIRQQNTENLSFK